MMGLIHESFDFNSLVFMRSRGRATNADYINGWWRWGSMKLYFLINLGRIFSTFSKYNTRRHAFCGV